MALDRPFRCIRPSVVLILSVSLVGCAPATGPKPSASAVKCEDPVSQSEVEKVRLYREAETERAQQLIQEIERLQADLRTAEAALVEAESGLVGNHTRADAVSSLAVTRIQVERAESLAPWRSREIESARKKLREAERQVDENRLGAALFFVYRARRVAESILGEVELVRTNANVRVIRARRVNLRAGPSEDAPILATLEQGTPIFPQADDGPWVLVQVSNGPVGWVHGRLVGGVSPNGPDAPAAPQPKSP